MVLPEDHLHAEPNLHFSKASSVGTEGAVSQALLRCGTPHWLLCEKTTCPPLASVTVGFTWLGVYAWEQLEENNLWLRGVGWTRAGCPIYDPLLMGVGKAKPERLKSHNNVF